MKTLLVFGLAAVAEIGGSFAFWAWARLDRTILWLAPGLLLLAIFAYLLTLAELEFAGRSYAAFGGIYIAASLGWLWAVEGARPDRWDTIGGAITLVGAAVILFGPRSM